MSEKNQPLVSIIMGSRSDLEIMREAADTLKEFGIAHELTVISAHRTPDRMFTFAKGATDRGLKVIVAEKEPQFGGTTADKILAEKLKAFKADQDAKVRDGINALKQQFPNGFDK